MKCDDMDNSSGLSNTLRESTKKFFCKFQHETFQSKFKRLKQVLLQEIKAHGGSDSFRGILFVQQRVTTHILDYFVKNDNDLKDLFSSAPLYTIDSPATPSLKITKNESKTIIQRFQNGSINLLISTV